MRIVLVLLSLFMVDAFQPARAETSPDVTLYAQEIPASELVGLLYREVLQRPFVTSPSVQSNRSPISLHIAGTQEDARRQASEYLSALGFQINTVDGIDRVELPRAPTPVEVVTVPFFYKPQWREAEALTAYLRPLFPDARFSADPTGQSSSRVDTLVVHATPKDIAQMRQLLPDIDQPVPDLVIKAAVFEVSTTSDDGSGIQLALGLLDGSLNLGIGAASVVGGGPPLPSTLGSFLSISSSSIEAVVSSLSNDGRFSLVTAPSVRARSGSPTTFNVGQSVPVLGAVTFQDGAPVQSVDYRDAGVIFTVRPVVQERITSLDLEQEISDFVQTTTGVNNTPTLTRRSLRTNLSAQDGDVIMLGGLTQSKNSDAREGFSFLPDFMRTARASDTRTDLLLVLQVVRMDPSDPSGSYVASRDPLFVDPYRFGSEPAIPSAATTAAIKSGAAGLF